MWRGAACGFGAIVLAVVACGDGGGARGDDTTSKFDVAAWRSATVDHVDSYSEPERCGMVGQISDVLSVGMNSERVLALLGDQNMTIEDGRLSYTLGACDMSLDYDELWILLDNGRVTEWQVVQG